MRSAIGASLCGIAVVFAVSVASGQARTACIQYEGRVVCGPLVNTLPPSPRLPQSRPGRLPHGSRALQPQTCRSAYGRTECGYNCVAEYGQLQCAQTPLGACTADYGRVVCWDPPPNVARRFANAQPASCMSAGGNIACGWSCVAAFGSVRCAVTPDGACAANMGSIVCSGD